MSLPLNTATMNNKPIFIFGTKLKTESEFFLQVVDNEKRKSTLERKFLMMPEIDWFVIEHIAPLYMEATEKEKEPFPVGDERWLLPESNPELKDIEF